MKHLSIILLLCSSFITLKITAITGSQLARLIGKANAAIQKKEFNIALEVIDFLQKNDIATPAVTKLIDDLEEAGGEYVPEGQISQKPKKQVAFDTTVKEHVYQPQEPLEPTPTFPSIPTYIPGQSQPTSTPSSQPSTPDKGIPTPPPLPQPKPAPQQPQQTQEFALSQGQLDILRKPKIFILQSKQQTASECGLFAIENIKTILETIPTTRAVQDINKALTKVAVDPSQCVMWSDADIENQLAKDLLLNPSVIVIPTPQLRPSLMAKTLMSDNHKTLVNDFIYNRIHLIGFILGNMRQQEDPQTKKVSGGMGHWIAVVATSSVFGINFYIADSLNSIKPETALNDPRIHNLIEYIVHFNMPFDQVEELPIEK